MDGARVQKKSGGKPGPAVWVPAAILAVLLAAYLGLCGWVSASDTILPNVTAAGLDLSGMTQAEAEQAINENLSVAQQAGSGWAVGLSCDGYIGTLDGSFFQVDAASLAQASLSVGRGSFFTGGAQYLRHLLKKHYFQIIIVDKLYIDLYLMIFYLYFVFFDLLFLVLNVMNFFDYFVLNRLKLLF